MLDIYDNELLEGYPLGMLGVVVSTIQGEPLLVGIVVVVIDPLPVFGTQLGNGLHPLFVLHVTFKLPPVFT